MRDKVTQLLNEALKEHTHLFLIDMEIASDNKIAVIIDGDQGVRVEDCIAISRAIEHNLDREEEDFSLEVSTPDIAHPLKVKRQYIKNLNRILKVKNAEEEFEGTLVAADEDKIVLNWKAREPKLIGKGKVTVQKSVTIEYKDIIEAKVKIVF